MSLITITGRCWPSELERYYGCRRAVILRTSQLQVGSFVSSLFVMTSRPCLTVNADGTKWSRLRRESVSIRLQSSTYMQPVGLTIHSQGGGGLTLTAGGAVSSWGAEEGKSWSRSNTDMGQAVLMPYQPNGRKAMASPPKLVSRKLFASHAVS